MSELVIGVIVFVALTMAVVEGIALAILTALRVCDWLAERWCKNRRREIKTNGHPNV